MRTANCQSIKESVLAHLTGCTSVERSGDLCIITLPVQTVDDRLVDVFVEMRNQDFYLVHDAGKAANELILRGLNITASMHRHYAQLSQRMGVQWADEMFQSGCKSSAIAATAMAVAQCSSIATMDLMSLNNEPEEEGYRQQFGSALRTWSRSRASVKSQIPVKGEWRQHTFDFVAYPKHGMPIAINVISPAGSAIGAADRAAFRYKDLAGTTYDTWKKVLVQTHAETWSKASSELLGKCSSLVIPINTGEHPTPTMIENYFKQMAA